MTEQRLTIAVPSPSTSTSLGKAWSGTSWNSAGLCVNTEARAWMAAYGDAGDSTIEVHSKGSGSEGQLLIQSLTRNLYVFSATDSCINTAKKSILISGTDGVKLIAGHAGTRHQVAIGLIEFSYGSSYLTDIEDQAEIDEDTGAIKSEAAEEFIDFVEQLADNWVVLEATVGGVSMAHQLLRLLFAVGGDASSLVGTVASSLTMATKAISSNVDFGSVGEDNVPGLHLYSSGSVNLASTGFTSLHSGLSLLLTGTNCAGVGLISQAVVAGKSAVMKGLYSARLEGSEIEAAAGVDATLRATRGPLKLDGYEVKLDATGIESPSQLPSSEVHVSAMRQITMRSVGRVAMEAGSNVNLIGDTISVSAGQQVELKGPAYSVKVNSLSGIEITFQKKLKVVIGNDSFEADMAGVQGLKVTADGIEVGGKSTSMAVDAPGKWTFTAPLVQFL